MKLLIFLLSFNLCMANEVKVLKKGEVAPFDGVLFTKELERQIRNERIVADEKIKLLNELNDLSSKENEILKSRLELYQKKTTELLDMNNKVESSTFIKSAGYFLAGALITGVIGYGVIQAYR